jgi:hypothetical protein
VSVGVAISLNVDVIYLSGCTVGKDDIIIIFESTGD